MANIMIKVHWETYVKEEDKKWADMLSAGATGGTQPDIAVDEKASTSQSLSDQDDNAATQDPVLEDVIQWGEKSGRRKKHASEGVHHHYVCF